MDKLHLELEQTKNANIQLEAEKRILEKGSVERQNLLNAEVSQLKDQVSDLSAQNQLLLADVKRHQQQALLSLVQPDEEKQA